MLSFSEFVRLKTEQLNGLPDVGADTYQRMMANNPNATSGVPNGIPNVGADANNKLQTRRLPNVGADAHQRMMANNPNATSGVPNGIPNVGADIWKNVAAKNPTLNQYMRRR